MSTATREDIVAEAIDSYQLGRRGTHDLSGGVNLSTLQDDIFAGPGAAEGIEVGCDVRVRQDSTPGGGGTVRFAESRIDSRPQQSNGRFTIAPAMLTPIEIPDTVPVTGNDTTFNILYRPLRFQDMFDAIDQANSDYLWEKLLLPVTLIPDGDMLKATISTGTSGDWIENGASVPTRQLATFPYGLRETRVVQTGATQYVATKVIEVEAGQSYYVEATVRPQGLYSPVLIVQDLTNAVALLTETGTDDREPQILQNIVSMGSATRRIELRLRSDDAGAATTDWANVIFRKDSSYEHVVQDRSANPDRLGKLFATSYDQWAERGTRMQEVPYSLEMRTEGLWAYRTDILLSGMSVWHEEFIRRGALTSDTATVGLDKQDVAAVATYLMLDKRGLSEHERFKGAYKRAAQRASAVWSIHQEKIRTRDLVERAYSLPMV